MACAMDPSVYFLIKMALTGHHEDEPLHKRQAFIRWLNLQGRLQS